MLPWRGVQAAKIKIAKSSRKRVKIANISVVIASFLINITPLYSACRCFSR